MREGILERLVRDLPMSKGYEKYLRELPASPYREVVLFHVAKSILDSSEVVETENFVCIGSAKYLDDDEAEVVLLPAGIESLVFYYEGRDRLWVSKADEACAIALLREREAGTDFELR